MFSFLKKIIENKNKFKFEALLYRQKKIETYYFLQITEKVIFAGAPRFVNPFSFLKEYFEPKTPYFSL